MHKGKDFLFFLADKREAVYELTSERLLKLSRMFTRKRDLQTLAIVGLKVAEESVDGHLSRKRGDVQEATFGVLKEWRNSQINQRDAYVRLCAALRSPNVNMADFVSQALPQMRSFITPVSVLSTLLNDEKDTKFLNSSLYL